MKNFIKHLVFAFMVLGLSGFDYSKHNIPIDKIVDGGRVKMRFLPSCSQSFFLLRMQIEVFLSLKTE